MFGAEELAAVNPGKVLSQTFGKESGLYAIRTPAEFDIAAAEFCKRFG